MVEETEAWGAEVQGHTVTQEMRFGPRQPVLEQNVESQPCPWDFCVETECLDCREVTRGMLAQLLSWRWPSLFV